MRKYYYLLGVLFAGIGIASISAPSQAQRVNRNPLYYSQPYYTYRRIKASNLAYDAMRGCYGDKNLNECDRLIKIKNVVLNWCAQGDSFECLNYTNIATQERTTRTLYSN